ncbi:NCS2 family permease [Clostridium botulinum]|uniref:Xanthine/uracil permease family protein n=3 Tax=Clostridium TaxID=1485 RepID=A7GIE6_CLOBL|nr:MULTISPECIES: NCS2 family permease [Clostridium]EKX80630.1 xanthine/uracil permease family protein [Clostridium botulinum CFSAN001628]ABS41239.1 xanthine/uracil permease family protein [Clostridium botulinum F str. Langeland]ACA43661.1 xanthine/uracil permease family protein [Clostridium botulinum B1 str. Okra]ADG00920.1 xanthine/uracil permease family protein [Clostridium botulinum F str. 230613]KKM41847.1 guanine permease [Clostridium botulinum]
MENYFKLKENGTTFKTEILAGITTFMTMAYILVVNPGILSQAGMNFGAVFTATALSAAIATLLTGLYAKLPFAQAPGMGLNAFFAFTIVKQMGYSWEFALTAVFLEGIIFILLTIFNVREAIVNSIPNNIKKSISVGIGLLISFIGLDNARVVIHPKDGGTIVALGNITSGEALLAIIGILITGILLAKNIRGALLIGIVITTLIGIPMGITKVPTSFFSMPPSLSPIFLKFEWHNIFTPNMFIALFTLLFMDMFDTVGTLVGVATKAKMLDENGNVPRVKEALFCDAIGTTLGACLGTSTVSTFVESASGVAEGGRTGLTAVSTATMFLIALFISPLFIMIPSPATAPSLILVGLFMMSPIKEIELDDFTEAIPAFLTIIMMPLSYSISDGIVFGVVSYIVIKTLTGKVKDVSLTTFIIGILFVLKFFI